MLDESDGNYMLKNNIKNLRLEKGWSQQQLANKLNLTQSAIYMYESGQREPSFEILMKLSELFDCSLDYLSGKIDSDTFQRWDSDFQNSVTESKKRKIQEGYLIPVLSSVKCGIPNTAIEDIDYDDFDNWVELSDEYVRNGKYIALTVSGDSMAPIFYEGGTLIVKVQPDANSGDIVIAKVNGEDVCCKKLIKNQDGITLRSYNPSYDPMYYSNYDIATKPVTIIGKVVEYRFKF